MDKREAYFDYSFRGPFYYNASFMVSFFLVLYNQLSPLLPQKQVCIDISEFCIWKGFEAIVIFLDYSGR